MGKFGVFSGFLGSGKTTTMMELTKYYTEHYGMAAMISNDLGGADLADHRLAKLAGCNASELTGECICYQTQNLVDRLNMLFQEGCELVLSDIPGFGVGALEHVYHTLEEKYPGQFELAPFTVLVEPESNIYFVGTELTYILNAQLMEADLIVLNKCDLLNNQKLQKSKEYLKEKYPQAEIIGISAKTGDGFEELIQTLMKGKASMHRPDIGYGGAEFSEAMGKISEYNIKYYATVCCNDFDGTEYLLKLAREIQTDIASIGKEIPHLKLLAWDMDGNYGKVDLLGINREIETTKRFEVPCTEIAVVLNASAACPSEELDKMITRVVERISENYQLTLMIYKKECFGMGE